MPGKSEIFPRLAGISASADKRFYEWKQAYAEKGEVGLINSKHCPENPTLRSPPEIEEKILYLRKTYHLGQMRIAWYLERRLPCPAPREEKTAPKREETNPANPSLRETGARPPYPGRREVPQV